MARTTSKNDKPKIKGESPAKAPPLPAGADQPTRYAEQQGNGGETHQTTSNVAATLTSQQGIPIANRRKARVTAHATLPPFAPPL